MLSNVPSIQNLDKKFLSYIKKIPPENVCCIIYTSRHSHTKGCYAYSQIYSGKYYGSL